MVGILLIYDVYKQWKIYVALFANLQNQTITTLIYTCFNSE